jgi:hypothetical protein
LRTDAPEIELMAFHPVVAIIENTTTSMLPQYPNEYRLWYVRDLKDIHLKK